MATYLEYARAAMNRAEYEEMEDGEWYASIPGFEGLWAVGPTREDTREQLYRAGRVALYQLRNRRESPPVVDGVALYAPPKPIGM